MGAACVKLSVIFRNQDIDIMHTIISQAECERRLKSQNAKVEAQASEWLYLLAEVPETVAQSPRHNFSLFAVILAKFSWKYSCGV